MDCGVGFPGWIAQLSLAQISGLDESDEEQGCRIIMLGGYILNGVRSRGLSGQVPSFSGAIYRAYRNNRQDEFARILYTQICNESDIYCTTYNE